MLRTLPMIFVATVSSVAFAGCGSSSAPAPTRGTTPEGAGTAPIVRDIAELGRAAAIGETDGALREIRTLLLTAQSVPDDREGWKGLALIRSRLPGILDRFLAAYPRTAARLAALRMHTIGGIAIKRWLLGTYRAQLRQLVRLRGELGAGGYAWAAVLQWSEQDHTEVGSFDARLSSILRGLPSAEQPVAERAVGAYLR